MPYRPETRAKPSQGDPEWETGLMQNLRRQWAEQAAQPPSDEEAGLPKGPRKQLGKRRGHRKGGARSG